MNKNPERPVGIDKIISKCLNHRPIYPEKDMNKVEDKVRCLVFTDGRVSA